MSADGWKRHWNIWERAAQHINERLVDLAGIRPGHRVLDVATGLGEPALTAARRVGPNGSVVATDLSPAMLVLARQEAARLGLRNVEFHEMDAEEPGLPAQSFAAALCRWALMFLPQLVVALTRLRELLVPQGRFAAAVWARPEKVPFTSVPMGVTTRVLQSVSPPAGAPGTFSLADEEVLRRAFTHAGFAEVAIERIHYPSNTPRSTNSSRSGPRHPQASARCLPTPLPLSSKRSGRSSQRRSVNIGSRLVSCVFRMKPSAWLGERKPNPNAPQWLPRRSPGWANTTLRL